MASLIPTKIAVTASGTPAGGVYPHFRVLVDGVKVGEGRVGATTKTYSFDTKVAAGAEHRVQVHYDNDAVISGKDRNLHVTSVKVGEHTMRPTDAGVTYDKHALDGRDVIPGQTAMLWSGALAFKAPASAFPEPAPATPTPTPAPPPAPAPAPPPGDSGPAYYTSPQGRDTWTGKLATPNATLTDGPVATLGKAVELARADATIDTIVMREGTYKLPGKITLQAADSGIKIKGYGDESPVIDGNQLHIMMQLAGAKNVTITDLTFTNGRKDGFAIELNGADGNRIGDNNFTNVGTAIKLHDASGNLIAKNEIGHIAGFGVEMATRSDGNKVYANHIHHIGEANSQAGAIAGHGSSNNTAAFNDIEYTARYGVSFKDFSAAEPGLNNAVLHNRIVHSNTAGGDTGAIEFLGRSNLAHGHRAEGNYIEDTGGLIKENGIGASGVYLDDLTNNTTVKGNFIKDTTWTDVMIHGGDNNVVENNFFILGPGEGASTVSNNGNIPTGSVATGNIIQKNILYGEAPIDKPWHLNNTGVNTVDKNLLHNVAKVSPSDTNSLAADPQFKNPAGGDFTLAAISPAPSIGIVGLDWSHMGTVGYDATTASAYGLPNFWG
jgi:parallel beta-helix repeat protein